MSDGCQILRDLGTKVQTEVAGLLHPLTAGFGTSRHFAVMQHFGRFRVKADIEPRSKMLDLSVLVLIQLRGQDPTIPATIVAIIAAQSFVRRDRQYFFQGAASHLQHVLMHIRAEA